jgi:hypothetical protein
LVRLLQGSTSMRVEAGLSDSNGVTVSQEAVSNREEMYCHEKRSVVA